LPHVYLGLIAIFSNVAIRKIYSVVQSILADLVHL